MGKGHCSHRVSLLCPPIGPLGASIWEAGSILRSPHSGGVGRWPHQPGAQTGAHGPERDGTQGPCREQAGEAGAQGDSFSTSTSAHLTLKSSLLAATLSLARSSTFSSSVKSHKINTEHGEKNGGEISEKFPKADLEIL